MSRTTTTGTAPQTGKAPNSPAQNQSTVPQEKVASRAYQKWLQGGCKHGCDQQHWYEAEQEIRSEMARAAGQKR
ncbi:MAG TPA: DUF2934 domain-containing protein [Gemmataceae bacterium]|nr:DUF2934 domain-containing protein [Gemmataceae bacterium]